MKLIRVFPRKTNATPDDENVRFSEPGLFDEADEVRVSVTWTWDKQRGEELAEAWRGLTSKVSIGGPAYDDPGGEFEPGMYVKHGYVMTSRGCPNKCWFCSVPKREGGIRELKIREGFNILDSNLLACSRDHIERVFNMLDRQHEKARFTGGLEAARMKPWIAERLRELRPHVAYFAYDTPDDYEPLVDAVKMLRDAGALYDRVYSCYVLIGYKGDTIEKAERRLQQVLKLDVMPMAMLFNKAEGKDDRSQWIKFQREYANRIIVGSKLTAARTAAQQEARHLA
ncbi:MAG TPA: hypothetical protein PLI62_00230 [Spirochaetota bacterium]|nr:hypothetical protein [Spirochaetota bacterium]